MEALTRHSAERCIRPPLSFFIPRSRYLCLSLETCTPLPWHPSWEITRFYNNTLKTINIKPWKPIDYRNSVLTSECVLIDIIVIISMAVGTGCSLPHGEVGTESHHIKTYNRLTIKVKLCAVSHQLYYGNRNYTPCKQE